MRKFTGLFLLLVLFFPVNEAGLGSFLKKIINPVMDISEQLLGDAVAGAVKLEYGVYKGEPAEHEWVNGVFKRVRAHAKRDVKYNITILDSDIVNAFAVLGGHIFVTKGLLKKAKSDDDLAAVIGHEIGHVEAKHSMKTVQQYMIYQLIMDYVKRKTNKDVATAADILNLFRSLKYSRDNEYEADSYGVRLAAAAGYNPYGMVSFLGVLKELSPGDPSRIEVSLRTHPATAERIKRTSELAATYGNEVTSRPMSLSYNYGDGGILKGASAGSPRDIAAVKKEVISREIYRIDFDERSETSGVAKGLIISANGGFFTMDGGNKAGGEFSQKMTTFFQNRPVSLVTAHIEVKPDKTYILSGKIKTLGVDGPGDVMGRGACVVINEFADTKFLKGHHNIGNRTGTQDFSDVSYEFKTTAGANRINLEFSLRNARGEVWFDSFVLKEY